jgi:uncharacterized protein (TIGR02145 family)
MQLPRLDTSGIRFALDTSLSPYRKQGISYDSFVDERDGQTYRSLLAYDRLWMAENLNYVADSSWWYRGVPDSGARYGRLYTWAAATGLPDSCNGVVCGSLLDSIVPGACPAGWRLPDSADWNALFRFLNDADGSMIRSQASWNGGVGSDTLGFGSTPSGYRTGSGAYLDAGTSTAWWTTSESDAGFCMSQFVGTTSRGQKATHKRIGNPIRCVRPAPLDSTLGALDVSNNILHPSFSPSVLTYTTDSFPSSTRSFRIVAVPNSPEATVTCNDAPCGEPTSTNPPPARSRSSTRRAVCRMS